MLRSILLLLCASALRASEEIPTPTLVVPPLDDQHSAFAAVLAAVVKPGGVDYATLVQEPLALDRYRAQLAAAVVPADPAAKLALYINAYNALTLALVVAKLPTDSTRWASWSIKDAGGTLTSVWKAYSFAVGGSRYTLDQLEHSVLRPLGDPRIHFALNCASRSCPALAPQPYLAATLEAQLERAAHNFVASTYHLRLEGGVVRLNPILDWFAEDFRAQGGVRAFLSQRTPVGPVRDYLLTNQPLQFFAYDWKLNLAGATP